MPASNVKGTIIKLTFVYALTRAILNIWIIILIVAFFDQRKDERNPQARFSFNRVITYFNNKQ